MSEPTQVYLVTSGEYSDYGIDSVWLTLDEARTAAKDWGRVEVWAIGEGQVTIGDFSHNADLSFASGEVLNEWTGHSADLREAEEGRILWWAGTDKVGIRVSAQTQERADKVYSEVKARLLADISMGLPPEVVADSAWKDGAWHQVKVPSRW